MKHPFRIGYGEDIHRLVPNRPLILCGTKIDSPLGLDGHSDADVAFHALSDALLGAIGEGDIGKHFPPDDPNCEGIDSSKIVQKCLGLVKKHGYCIGNIDLFILAEAPKLRPYEEAMKKRLSEVLEIEISDIGLQFGTNEKLDAVGEGKAIRTTCVCLLEEAK